MSKIILASDKVSKLCTNHSKTKQLYSFAKAPRFPGPRKEEYYYIIINIRKFPPYGDMPGTRSKRAASFGYGGRSDFTKTCGSASEVKYYDLPSIFAKKASKGYTFGISRDKWKVYSEGNPGGSPTYPAPNKYDTSRSHLVYASRSPRYSIYGRHEKKIVKEENHRQPGPGQYDVQLKNKKGMTILSKFPSYSTVSFTSIKSKRFIYDGKLFLLNGKRCSESTWTRNL